MIRPAWLLLTVGSMAPVLLLSYRSFGLVALAFWLAAWPGAWSSWRWALKPLAWLRPLAGLAAYGLASALWSPSDRSLDGFNTLLVLMVGGGVIAHGRVRPELFMLGVFAALVLLLFDAVTGNSLRALVPPAQTALRDGVATGRGLLLLLLLLPAGVLSAYRTGHWRLGRGMIILAGLAAASTPVQLNGLIVLSALVTMALTAYAPRVGLRAASALAGLVLVSPFVLSAFLPPTEVLVGIDFLPDSAVHRLIIWRHVLDAWLTSPIIFGEGVRATSALAEATGSVTLASGQLVEVVAVHPHHWILEVLFELGLVGYALLLAAFSLGTLSLLAAPIKPDMAAAIAALIVSVAMIASFEFSLWSETVPSAVVVGVFALRQVAIRDEP